MSGGGAARRQTRDRPRLRIIWAIYNSGEGVVQSYEKAAEWYRKAADQGYHWAQDNLGDLYHDGKGVPQSDLAAAEWYRKAADQGNKYSQLQIGNLLKNTWKDLKTAYKWYYLAYLNGHEDAQGKLNDIEGKGLIWNSAPRSLWRTSKVPAPRPRRCTRSRKNVISTPSTRGPRGLR